MSKLAVAALAGLVAWSGTASAYPGSTVRYEGSIVFTAVSAACGDVGFSAGERGKMVYRRKVADSDPADAIEIIDPFRFVTYNAITTDPSGSLNGSTATTTTVLDSGIVVHTDVPGSANLTIASFTGGALANNIRINGSLNDYFFTPGCTITFRAALTSDVN